MKAPQATFGERVPAFEQDVATMRAGRTLIDVVADALVRRFGTFEDAAQALDRAFGPEGRPVSGSTLRAAVKGVERNYFRAEWVALVADDEEVRAFFVRPVRTPAEELAAMREFMAKDSPGALDRFDRKVRR